MVNNPSARMEVYKCLYILRQRTSLNYTAVKSPRAGVWCHHRHTYTHIDQSTKASITFAQQCRVYTQQITVCFPGQNLFSGLAWNFKFPHALWFENGGEYGRAVTSTITCVCSYVWCMICRPSTTLFSSFERILRWRVRRCGQLQFLSRHLPSDLIETYTWSVPTRERNGVTARVANPCIVSEIWIAIVSICGCIRATASAESPCM